MKAHSKSSSSLVGYSSASHCLASVNMDTTSETSIWYLYFLAELEAELCFFVVGWEGGAADLLGSYALVIEVPIEDESF